MSGALLGLLAIGVLLLAYFTYGAYVAGKLGVDPMRPTPAHTRRDGVDYVPTHGLVLLGHHFASIAGAAPIVGPIAAAAFGWLPALLWVLVGAVFAGAVHDFASLIASVRHDGKSIGEVIGDNVGRGGRTLFLIFAWLALVLLLAAFVDILAGTFAALPRVATASVLFLLLAVAFGGLVRAMRCDIVSCSLLAVVLIFVAIALGYFFPLQLGQAAWQLVLLAYVVGAGLTPLWLLQQPRDYLNSFLLYMLLGSALVGVLVAAPDLTLPAFSDFYVAPIGHLFPMLFVTVACGAISGFHSLIASGTTSKLLKSEAQAQRIGYGAMLMESFLAVTAVIAVGVLSQHRYRELLAVAGPFAMYAQGVAGFLAGLAVPPGAGVTFCGLAVSAFALTMLDTAARLGRYTLQELAAGEGFPYITWLGERHVASGLTLGVAAALLFSGHFAALWPVFGAANQLLAALALLSATVWLARQRRDNRFVLLPTLFMLAVTLTALALLLAQGLADGRWHLSILCGLLFLLAIVLVVMAVRSLARAGQAYRPRGAAGPR